MFMATEEEVIAILLHEWEEVIDLIKQR